MTKQHSPSFLNPILQKLHSFEFFQMVRLIHGLLHSENHHQYSCRFRATPSFSFPISEVEKVKLLDGEDNADLSLIELHVAFGGLYGAHGLLPFHYTELVMERLQAKDISLRDFLDYLSQRFFSFFYATWQKNHFYAGYEQFKLTAGEPDCFTHMLNCLVGQQGREFPGLLRYSGAFSNQRRSMVRLENILADYFQIGVKVLEFQGVWIFLADGNRTKIGILNHQLGINTLVGSRVFDSQHHFRLQLGPLRYEQFQSFLPGSRNLGALKYLSRRYIGMGLSFDVQLVLNKEEIPPCKLSSGICLGYNGWLGVPSLRDDLRSNPVFV